jgi:hypothetical protein
VKRIVVPLQPFLQSPKINNKEIGEIHDLVVYGAGEREHWRVRRTLGLSVFSRGRIRLIKIVFLFYLIWQLPTGLSIDVKPMAVTCSHSSVENFLLQRNGDPFLRRFGIGPQTAKLQENFLLPFVSPIGSNDITIQWINALKATYKVSARRLCSFAPRT